MSKSLNSDDHSNMGITKSFTVHDVVRNITNLKFNSTERRLRLFFKFQLSLEYGKY